MISLIFLHVLIWLIAAVLYKVYHSVRSTYGSMSLTFSNCLHDVAVVFVIIKICGWIAEQFIIYFWLWSQGLL